MSSSSESKMAFSGRRWTTEKIDRSGPASEPLRAVRFSDAPAWLISSSVHIIVFILIAVISVVVPHGTGAEVSELLSISGTFSDTSNSDFFSPEPSSLGVETSSSISGAIAAAAAAATNVSGTGPPIKAADLLASLTGAGVNPVGASGIGEMTGSLNLPGGSARGGGRGTGGAKSTTKVFGIEGTGNTFVYVFDRSGSMDGYSGRPLQAAKQQLIDSLNALDSSAQFQILFYNDSPHRYVAANGARNLVFATDKDKEHASRYVRGVHADGGTDHLPAIKQAIGMGPDVVFFLTDAAMPSLSRRQIEDLSFRCGSTTTIHAIEFGAMAKPPGASWIEVLATSTRGKYRYVDLTQL